MSAISVKTIRQRVAAAIAASGSLTGWQAATGPYDTFVLGDGDNRKHKSYAVGCPSSEWTQKDRQKLAEGAWTQTQVGIRWAYNLAALDQVASYDEALDSEAAIVVAAMTVSAGIDLHLTWVSSRRSVEGGWVIGEMQLVAMHHLALA